VLCEVETEIGRPYSTYGGNATRTFALILSSDAVRPNETAGKHDKFCWILGSHSGAYKDYHILDCDAV
jgi:hypothetical protein